MLHRHSTNQCTNLRTNQCTNQRTNQHVFAGITMGLHHREWDVADPGFEHGWGLDLPSEVPGFELWCIHTDLRRASTMDSIILE